MTDERTEDDWLHFELSDEEIAEYTALREDIPEWLERSLWGWIKDAFTAGPPIHRTFDNRLVRKCERKLRVRISYNFEEDTDLDRGLRAVKAAYRDRAVRDLWRLVNFLLLAGRAHGGTLKTVLLDCGSVWTVQDYKGKCYLERRVPAAVRDAAERAFQLPNGGNRLAEAWEAVFGVDPDPSRAYSLAIKAVEDAAIRVVCPNKDEAVLGHVIGELNSNPKWKMPHKREHDEAPAREVLVSMLRMLYRGQHDRHGGMPVPLPDMTQEEAESAVILAVALVGWFATGKVTKG